MLEIMVYCTFVYFRFNTTITVKTVKTVNPHPRCSPVWQSPFQMFILRLPLLTFVNLTSQMISKCGMMGKNAVFLLTVFTKGAGFEFSVIQNQVLISVPLILSFFFIFYSLHLFSSFNKLAPIAVVTIC